MLRYAAGLTGRVMAFLQTTLSRVRVLPIVCEPYGRRERYDSHLSSISRQWTRLDGWVAKGAPAARTVQSFDWIGNELQRKNV